MGRKIWIHVRDIQASKIEFFAKPVHVTGFKQFLPAGEYERHNYQSGTTELTSRKRSLVQIFTDPGGLRTVAVADIWAKDPGLAKEPW